MDFRTVEKFPARRVFGKYGKFNLLTDDYQEIAEHIGKLLDRNGKTIEVIVRATGAVTIENPCRGIEAQASEYVGTYTRAARIEQVEDDLLERLRELRAA